ncbi:uncharacterized protein LOC128392540 isoform X1 [Panonychus citri]|uniref:uncharacterized protein LOC128392540 isoform X1 n=1 Tax=Panonychus citri TaxID=50023 RepID=UPI0023071FB4|nr:uncharacterized protein LOC128392540 isoform X1 [Panonychus citri]
MKSILLFVACVSVVISSTVSVKITGTCPTPTKPPGIDYWYFSYFTGIKGWYEVGHSDETVPRTVYNTIEFDHLYPGKVYMLRKGATRDIEVQSLWDKKVDYVVGDFDGKSYYDILDDDEPVSFKYTNEDGKRVTVSMPYYNEFTAMISTCSDNGDGTVDLKAWYISRAKKRSIPDEVQKVAKSLIGKNLSETCQGDFC